MEFLRERNGKNTLLARLEGVEPPAYGSEVRRSILLSYRRTTTLLSPELLYNFIPLSVNGIWQNTGGKPPSVKALGCFAKFQA